MSVRRPRAPAQGAGVEAHDEWPPETAQEIEACAVALDRLSISRTDPHRFFEQRSELSERLRRIVRGGRPPRS